MEKLTFFSRKTMTPPMEAAEDIRRSSLLFHHYKEDDVSQTLGQLLERVGDASGADHQVLELDELTGTPDTSPKPGGGIPFVLAFTDLTYSVKTSKKLSLFLSRGRCRTGPLAGGAAENPSPNTKTLLESISGEARNGEILAVLGASGSGKSTLIDALANRIAKDSLKGSVTLNGEALESKLLRAISAYVMQDDLLYPMLTVEETLVFSAEFRLPRALSKAKKKGRVEMLIDQLGLRRAANTIIGDEGHRGVSGGERRRVSIGIDIIHDPIILFLDEPTSGLDSSSAYMVIKVLQRIAHSGSIVIMSIHQPSYRKNRILKRVLRSDREKESAPAVSAHSHTGAALEVIPATVETIIRAVEEEPASKKPQTEEETAVEVFKPSDAAFKLFKGKGVIDPRLSKEATDLSELPFVPGDDSTRHPNPLMRKFHISSSQSLDAAGGQRLVDTLMDFSGAEKALGAGVSASDGSRREQGIDNQVEISPVIQGEDETCSPHVVERVDEPIMVEESREREAIEIVKAVPVPLLMITTAGEAEDIVPLGDGDEGPAVAIVSEPFLTGGEDLPASVPGEGTLAPPASGSHGTVPPESPPRDQASMVNIEYVVEKILMKKLSNNWSLDAHRKRIDDTVARSKENKEAIERFSQSLAAVEKTVAAMQESITDLWECGAGQDVIYTRMRGEIATVSTGQELALEQIRDLQNMIEKTTEDISTNEAEKKKFMLNHSSFLEKHEIEHRAVNARLGSLEELRRYDNMSRGLEQTAEYSSAFMAGF